jgi:hypothetical protein
MKWSCRKWLSGLFAVMVLASANTHSIVAQEAATPAPSGPEILFAAYPEGAHEGVYYEEFIGPGESHEFRLALRNSGANPLALLVYPADVYTMINGGMGVNFQNQERTGPASWFDFPEGVVDIGPGEEVVRLFTVSVPEGTQPGQYVAAIGVETADSFAVGEVGGAFRQKIRKVVAVSILVPGDANPSFEIGQPVGTVIQGQTLISVPLENTGNVRVRPTGTVTLANSGGEELATSDVAMSSVYMGDSAPFEIWLPMELPPGEYSVSVDLADPDTGATASVEDVPVTVVLEATPVPATPDTPPIAPPSTPVPVEPVMVHAVEIAANGDDIQFANIAFDIENTGNHLARSRVTLSVSHNGELVEEFVIDDNLPLPVGATAVEDRYIPPTGWEPGTWTFSITVHSISGNDNVETVVLSEEDVATIEVP